MLTTNHPPPPEEIVAIKVHNNSVYVACKHRVYYWSAADSVFKVMRFKMEEEDADTHS